MAQTALKDHTAISQMKTVQRASERVSSWPEWKRTMTLYRNSNSGKSAELTCSVQRDSPKKEA